MDRDPKDILFDCIQDQLVGDESNAAIRLMISVSWEMQNQDPLGDDEVEGLLARLTPSLPTLLVDWGHELPRIGHNARPQFMLLCPDGYSSPPDIDVTVDPKLDSDQPPRRSPRAESNGLWEFFVPFGLTTGGDDCRPGHYLLELDIRFPALSDRSLPRFFRCTIRLHVPPADDGGEPELIIKGDGQSVVNLHGHDLKSFGRVVLEGGDGALINLQQGVLRDADSDDDSETESPSITHSYELKVDQDRSGQIPYRSTQFINGQRLESAMLELETQQRWLLLPKRKARWNWTFGRNRGNDVVTRFLPRTKENDDKTAKLSRRHLELELTDEGLQFQDHSSSGTWLDGHRIEDEHLLGKDADDGSPHSLELGDPLGNCFYMDLRLFSQPDDPRQRSEQEIRSVLCYEALDEPVRQLSHARESQIDTVLLTRTDELQGQEAYVLLCCHVSIGNSETFSSIAIDDDADIQKDHARIFYAQRTFWLENRTSDPSLVLINGDPLPPLELAPLACEMELTFGSTIAVFNRTAQLHL